MKLLDIVAQLQVLLPRFTNKVSTVLTIASISATTDTVTITTTGNHGLLTGHAVTLADIATQTAISGVSQAGNLFTFTTSTAHDLTFGWRDHEKATLSGFTDSAWNDSFTITSVPNRTTFVVRSTNTIPTLNTNEKLEEVRDDGINGQFPVTKVSDTVFTVSGTFLAGTYTGGTVNARVRIAGAVTVERAIEQYTERQTDELWIFVTMNDAAISKDRHSFSDAAATRGTGDDIRIRMLDGFLLTIIIPASDDGMATDALDVARHDLFAPIMKSLFGALFTTGLTGDPDFKAVPVAHGVAEYNRATLVYSYEFEVPMELITDDAVHEGNTRAFRDINYTQVVGGDDTTDMTDIPINLDDNP